MALNVSDVDPSIVTFGEFRLDFRLRCAYRGSEEIKISPIPFNTLEFLVQNRHRVVSKAELLEAVWGGQRDPSTVEHAISQLRRAFTAGEGNGTERCVQTVPGHGYRFVGEVVECVPAPSTPLRQVAGAGTLASRKWFSGRRTRMILLGGTTLLILVAVAIASVAKRHAPEIATVSAAGRTLTAKSASGDVVWTHQFDSALWETPSESAWRTQIVDLKGDGRREILVAASYVNPPSATSRDELFCFSSRGQLLWRYRPETQIEFRTTGLNGPWLIYGMLVVDDGKSKSVWIAVEHRVWWPSFLVKISPDGARQIMFTSSGNINSLFSVRTAGNTYVIAGGINNEYNMASVAVLSVNGSPATSPQNHGSQFECIRGCPTGRPYRYLLLPRSELNAASDMPYNNATEILPRPGGVAIRTTEMSQASQFFDLSEDFLPSRVMYSSDYAAVHRRAESEGRISHSFIRCPEPGSPALVRVFDEQGNSRTVPVPRVL